MKIVKLTAENVKRLTAIEITPEGTLITVGGKNGAGKSSVLDSIAYALGGKDLVPKQPIRGQEKEAKIVVDLGDLVVTRRFFREKELDVPGSSDAVMVWGETKSTLTVKNKEGASYPSPQAVLDKLLGKLTFDPLQFARASEKEQDETLRKLVGLDFTLLNGQRRTAYEARAMHKKSYTAAVQRLEDMPKHSGVPETEIDIDAISNEVKRGNELRKTAEEAINNAEKEQTALDALQNRAATHQAVIREIQDRLKQEEVRLEEVNRDIKTKTQAVEVASKHAFECQQAVPNFEELDKKLRDIDATNQKVRANQKVITQTEEVKRLAALVAEQTEKIELLDSQKADALRKAKFPVPGLSLTDDGVVFQDVPFSQASTAEQIRVSVAIGLALNPTLKVLLVRNGNGLDSEFLKAITAQASEADAQLWMEWVAESKDGVAVMLEDGAIV